MESQRNKDSKKKEYIPPLVESLGPPKGSLPVGQSGQAACSPGSTGGRCQQGDSAADSSDCSVGEYPCDCNNGGTATCLTNDYCNYGTIAETGSCNDGQSADSYGCGSGTSAGGHNCYVGSTAASCSGGTYV